MSKEQGEAMTPTATDAAVETQTDETAEDVVVEDVLVEDVSIDGMCGVY
jgi:mycofactocin precursor